MKVWVTCDKIDGQPASTVDLWAVKPRRSTKNGEKWACFMPSSGSDIANWQADGVIGTLLRSAFNRSYKGREIAGGEIMGPLDLRLIARRAGGAEPKPEPSATMAVAEPPQL